MIDTFIQAIKYIFGKKYPLEHVFTPSTAATLTFVERPEIDNEITRAFMLPGTQIILYGHTGSGKTTIIQNTLREKETKFITTNCMIGTKVDNIMLDAFDKLGIYYKTETSKKLSETIGLEAKANYLAIESTLKSELNSENTDTFQRILPPQLSPQRLSEFLGIANIVWIIEDFHKVEESERQKFSQILKIFVDASIEYPNVKVIAIGAVGTARSVINYDIELNNRVAEIHVPLMTDEEIKSIIQKGENLLNIKFAEESVKEIIRFSNGLAAICHHLCFSFCFNNSVLKTVKFRRIFTSSSIKEAILNYITRNSDSFKEILDKALKLRDETIDHIPKNLLQSFCRSKKEELTKKEILKLLPSNNKFSNQKSLSEVLRFLTTSEYGEILRYDDNSGKFSFSNPFLKAYASMQFSIEEPENKLKDSEIDFELSRNRLEAIFKLLVEESSNVEITLNDNHNLKFKGSSTDWKN